MSFICYFFGCGADCGRGKIGLPESTFIYNINQFIILTLSFHSIMLDFNGRFKRSFFFFDTTFLQRFYSENRQKSKQKNRKDHI